jgi:hypothetical protein
VQNSIARLGAHERSRTAACGTLGSMTLSTSKQSGPGRPGRNEPCHCGSGRKYKQCCLAKDEAKATAARAEASTKAEAAAQAAGTSAEAPATPAPAPLRAAKPPTDQPWKATTSRGYIPRSRTPRKIGS